MSDAEISNDVVALLTAQHQRIRSMFDAVEKATGEEQQDRFAELRRLLAVHETAEEMVVHPRVRLGEGGNDVVDARLAEEHSAKEVLASLDKMKVGDAGFDGRLGELRASVLAHADNEEAEEFPLLVAATDEKTRATMAAAVRAAEAIAPTHPHPGIESATANFVAGPVASVVDRTRDAVRAVLGRG
jgi:hemerythrin superfamily protein